VVSAVADDNEDDVEDIADDVPPPWVSVVAEVAAVVVEAVPAVTDPSSFP
jgi:hypothetical protein